MNQPRLRFKEFKGEWEHNNLIKILKIKNGKSQKKVENKHGKYPILATGGIIGRTDSYLYDKESVLIGRKGTINKPQYMNSPFWTVDTLFYSKIHINNDGKFIYDLFQTINWNKYNTSTGVPSLTSSNIENIKVVVPNYPEQQKIGQLFQNLDQQIELQSDKLEHLKQSKQGYLQKMFPTKREGKPKFRFSFFNDKYNSMLLSNIVKIRTGNKNVEDNDPNGKYVFFDRSSEIKHLDTYDFDGITIVYPGEGAKFLPRYFDGKYSLHQRAYGLYDFKNVSPFYLYSFLKRTSNLFVRFSVGTTAKSLRKDTFSHINVPIPSLPEQQRIGQFFSHLDHLIDLQQQKVNHLKRQKQAYLQKMFV